MLRGAYLKEISSSPSPQVYESQAVAALAELLGKVPPGKLKIGVTWADNDTVLRVIAVPPMPAGELKQALLLEAKNFFPSMTENSRIESEPLYETTEKGIKKIQVAIAAAPAENVTRTLDLLKKAGIHPTALLPIPSALKQIGEISLVDEKQIRCLVDVGCQSTELVILKGRNLCFSRKIPMGGLDFTRALTVALVSSRGRTQLSLKEAEDIKRSVGIPEEGGPEASDKISNIQTFSMLRAAVEQLTGEIDRCLDYYREESDGDKVDTLELFGRGADLKGLTAPLTQALGMEVKKGEPLRFSKIRDGRGTPGESLSAFASAVGAAFGGEGINLLPAEMKHHVKHALKRASIQSAAIGLCLVLFLVYLGMNFQRANFDKRIAVSKVELASLESELEKVSGQSLAHQILAEEPYWEEILKEISNILPSRAILKEINMHEDRLFLKGRILSGEKEKILSDFIFKLESGIFKNVKLVTAKAMAGQAGSEFEIECQWK